jgi:hypothetical protein
MLCSFCCLIPITIGAIYWNELNLVISDATAGLVGQAHVVHACSPTDEYNGRLVYTECRAQCPEIADLLDPTLKPFITSFEGTELSWDLEIYQYEETSNSHCHKNNDGSKTCHTTYSYSAGWHSNSINSNSFHSSYYSNRGTTLPDNIKSSSVDAPDYSVMLLNDNNQATFSLPNKLAQMFPSKTIYPTSGVGDNLGQWGGAGPLDSSMLHVSGEYLVTYHGGPRIGDLRISVSGKTGTKASVAAKQVSSEMAPGFTFKDYPPQPFDFWGRKTYPLGRLEAHIESKQDFIQEWLNENADVAIILRLVLLVLMIVWCCMFLSPLSVMADLLRIINCFTCGLGTLLDNAAQTVIGAMACGLGCCVFSIVWAVSWFLVRPTLSVFVLFVGFAAFAGLHYLKTQQGKAAEAREAAGYVTLASAPRVGVSGRKVQPTVQIV